ncbi:phage tail tube protein [Fusobacterium necrophorum]|uniref:Phage tail tube protein n=1 Tax=Fusobacterium necrophorum TaxID=859 RepID=A0AAW6WEJ0_9FUSO|nr:phage tail tube protein [Fusobacterium necrophorum]KYM44605.1 terminase [Fusobacterium necrophorum subsp. funduliforme]KYM50895.1 terminase [Fusobacterium necrophorum subsp. funduliforme]MDK4481716.1 phage tail tube protein [Fusobacterium necrophorum]MDK4512865.1 phage tail tube protein [Fusobacterium necrophorum]MDK4515655.1 phage tail tube protein [Fusobacterium necrophorum]
MAEQITRGNQTISGAYGTLWLNNEKVMELKSVEAKVTAERTDVQLGLSIDSKIIGLKGEGTITVNKVYTRGKKLLEDWLKGKDTRSRIVTSIQDPDAVGKGEERVSIDNVWFNAIDLAKFTRGEVVEEELPFGFTPEDVKYENAIK